MFLCGELKILCGDEWVVDDGTPNTVSCIRSPMEGEEEGDEICATMNENTKIVTVMFKERGIWCEETFRCEMEAFEHIENRLLCNDAYAYEEWCHEAYPVTRMTNSILGKRKYSAM